MKRLYALLLLGIVTVIAVGCGPKQVVTYDRYHHDHRGGGDRGGGD